MKHFKLAGFLSSIALLALNWLAAWAAPPAKLSEVATTDDIEAEVVSKLNDVEQALHSTESYRERRDSLRRSATHLAIYGQALAEHDSESKLRLAGADLRDAALSLAHDSSFDDASKSLALLKTAAAGKATGSARVDFDWSKLAQRGWVMSALKSHSESLRRAMRRPGDPREDSRHATNMALLALVLHGDFGAVKDPADRPRWQALSLEVQQHMTRAAAAIKNRDESAADHFRMGMEACNTCHETFKR